MLRSVDEDFSCSTFVRTVNYGPLPSTDGRIEIEITLSAYMEDRLHLPYFPPWTRFLIDDVSALGQNVEYVMVEAVEITMLQSSHREYLLRFRSIGQLTDDVSFTNEAQMVSAGLIASSSNSSSPVCSSKPYSPPRDTSFLKKFHIDLNEA